jgi:hypothetical protein
LSAFLLCWQAEPRPSREIIDKTGEKLIERAIKRTEIPLSKQKILLCKTLIITNI